MKALPTAAIACLLIGTMSCAPRNPAARWPEYGDRDLEVLLPQPVLDSTNCTVPDFGVPWYKDHADATIELLAVQQTIRPVIRLRSLGVTHVIGRFEYNVTMIQKGEFPEKTVSFLTFSSLKDGAVESRLILPGRCKFFLKRGNGQFRILSIEGDGP